MSTPEGLCTKCSATQYCAEHEPQAGGQTTAERIADIRKLLAGVTPIDEHTMICRYDHGGGRLYREVPNPNRRGIYAGDGDRTLIADFYREGDREFYNSAVRNAEYLLDLLESRERVLLSVSERVEAWLKAPAGCEPISAGELLSEIATPLREAALSAGVESTREEPKQPNPCPRCGAFLWSDPRPCWSCARAESTREGQGR